MIWDVTGEIPLWRAVSEERLQGLGEYLRRAFSEEPGTVIGATEERITFRPAVFPSWGTWEMVSRCEVELPRSIEEADSVRYRVALALVRLMCGAGTALLIVITATLWFAGESRISMVVLLVVGLAWIWGAMYYVWGRNVVGARVAKFVEDQIRAFEALQ